MNNGIPVLIYIIHDSSWYLIGTASLLCHPGG